MKKISMRKISYFIKVTFKEGPRFAQLGSEDMKKKFVFYGC